MYQTNDKFCKNIQNYMENAKNFQLYNLNRQKLAYIPNNLAKIVDNLHICMHGFNIIQIFVVKMTGLIII